MGWMVLVPFLIATGIAGGEAPETSRHVTMSAAPEAVILAQADASERKGLFKKLRQSRQQKRLAKKGAVCGDLAIQGEVVGRVPGRIRGCGVDNAVRIRSVSGVALSQHSVMDCVTAQALKSWIDKGVKPAVGKKGGGVTRLRVAAHYACRTRNNRKGGRISEHGKGRAIDISAIFLRDGSEISVLKHWGSGRKGRILKKLHRAACGPFGTVLGPNSDRYHRDHFHFDTARYRGGSYCR